MSLSNFFLVILFVEFFLLFIRVSKMGRSSKKHRAHGIQIWLHFHVGPFWLSPINFKLDKVRPNRAGPKKYNVKAPAYQKNRGFGYTNLNPFSIQDFLVWPDKIRTRCRPGNPFCHLCYLCEGKSCILYRLTLYSLLIFAYKKNMKTEMQSIY